LLLTWAAAAHCTLLRRLGARAALDLVPGPRVGGGIVDTTFRDRIGDSLRATPFLTTATGAPVTPRDAILLDIGGEAEDIVDIVSELVPHLLPGSLNPRHPAPAILGIPRMGPADLADALSDTDRSPKWWANLYAALSGADTTDLG